MKAKCTYSMERKTSSKTTSHLGIRNEFKKNANNTYLGTFHFVLILITAMFSYSSIASIWFEDDNEAGELLETAAIPRGFGE